MPTAASIEGSPRWSRSRGRPVTIFRAQPRPSIDQPGVELDEVGAGGDLGEGGLGGIDAADADQHAASRRPAF